MPTTGNPDVRTSPVAETPQTLPAILDRRADETPDVPAYTYLRDGEEPAEQLTYAQLRTGALARARALVELGVSGRHTVLMYPNGLEFVRAWFATMYAAMPAAPIQVPNRRYSLQRLRAVCDDAGTTTVLTTAAVRDRLLAEYAGEPDLAAIRLVATDELRSDAPGKLHAPGLDDIAVLQYTSGSTGTPKGVMVTQRNFWFNACETDLSYPGRPDGTVVSWLPLFHDMGLLISIVLPLWAGIPAYLMTPEAFIRRPGRWLEAISRFRGTHGAAPNFAYDLCVQQPPATDIDLSSWRAVISGAEPIRHTTIETFMSRFASMGLRFSACAPAYGLAENTLKVTGCPAGSKPTVERFSSADLQEGRAVPAGPDLQLSGSASALVGCGWPVGMTSIRIVDPVTRAIKGPNEVGEIWVNGPCVANGYFRRPADTEQIFRARIANHPDDRSYLRTGDAGFLHDGELFITGRLKDVLVVKGRNHYPQDLEHSVERSHSMLRPGCAAVFAAGDGQQELIIVVVEVDGRVVRRDRGLHEVAAAVREAVFADHRICLDDVVLIRRGTLPKTTSGKVRRRLCRQQYLSGSLHQVRERATADGPVPCGDELLAAAGPWS